MVPYLPSRTGQTVPGPEYEYWVPRTRHGGLGRWSAARWTGQALPGSQVYQDALLVVHQRPFEW